MNPYPVILIAPDSFKGSLSSGEAAAAIARGARRVLPHASLRCHLLADGGEGTARALAELSGAVRVLTETCDPLSRPVTAEWFLSQEKRTAFIDTAAASGLTLLSPAERDAALTSTYGTGQLIAAAVDRGAKHIILGLGGSATMDFGYGALQALGAGFSDENGDFLINHISGSDLGRIRKIHTPQEMRRRLDGIRITCACDVLTPPCGALGAVAVFGPQKGLNPDEIVIFQKYFSAQAALLTAICGEDIATLPRGGAAGGIGATLHALLGATLADGARLVIGSEEFSRSLAEASLVITGEGSADRQTLLGKGPGALMLAAREKGIPTIILAGKVSDRDSLLDAGFAEAVCINDSPTDRKTPLNTVFSGISPLPEQMCADVASRRLEAAAALALSRFFRIHSRK